MKDTFNDGLLKTYLLNMSEDKFFEKMMHVFTSDTSPLRMHVAIQVMEERFSAHSKSAQLTCVLDRAVRKNNITMLGYLLHQGAHINGTETGYIPGLLGPASAFPLSTAIAHGTEKTLEYLLSMGADPNPPKNSFLYDAAYINDSISKTRILLDAGATGGAEAALYSLIHVSQRRDTAVTIMEKTGLGVNVDNGRIVKSAVISLYKHAPGAEDTVQFLLSRGADFAAAARSFEAEYKGSADAPKLAKLALSLTGQKPEIRKNVGSSRPKY